MIDPAIAKLLYNSQVVKWILRENHNFT